MCRKTKLKLKKLLAAVLTGAMLFSSAACSSPEEFYHEVILGETTSNGSKKKKKDKQKEEKTTEESLLTTESDLDDEEEIEYATTENAEFQALLQEYMIDTITSDTLTYNSLVRYRDSFPEAEEKMEIATLGDPSMDEDVLAEAKKNDEDFYNRLMEFEGVTMTEDEMFTFETLKEEYERGMLIYDHMEFYEPFSPMYGQQEGLTSNFVDYTFDDKKDVDDYISFSSDVRDFFGTLIEYEYKKSDAGYFMNDAVAEEVIEQCDEFMKEKEDHVLILSFDEKIDAVDFLTDEEKAEYKEKNKSNVLDIIIPAYQDLKDALEDLKGTGKNDKGICYYEGGKDYYANYIFPSRCGSSKTPEEEAKIMDDRWDELFVQLSSLYYSNTEGYNYYVDHDDEVFAKFDEMDINDLVDDLQENYLDRFPVEEKIPFTVKYMSDSVAKISETTVAYYQVCPLDDPNFNQIVVNPDFEDDRFNTLAHEGTPGHMLQFWYFRNTDPNPARNVAFNLGYIEGWAIYSSNYVLKEETIDTGSDYDDFIGKIAQIDMDLGYLMMGRADIGINYEGWDKDDVVDYLTGKVQEGMEEEVAEDLMTTSTGDPGAYLSYTTSFYEMEELRKYAEDELGSKFDEKEFHKVILETGPCQYQFLRKKVNKYIRENR
ncbi:Uncharacterized conserved protein, DUF885 familyt [Lachnospiraceae bacterium NE2001]|nr:Uncharacterized conserved protein, DUF885 familyt [Lachnospiraceae bacterium NE2001]